MFPQTAFYCHQSPPHGRQELSDNHFCNKGKKMNSSHQGKLLRLNSLEGTCQTYPSSENIKMAASVDTKMPPSRKESKWFGHYELTDQPLFHQHWPPVLHQQQQYWPTPTAPNYHYQVPYNLTKGQFEVWPMQAESSATMDQVAYVRSNTAQNNVQANQGFSKCVSSILEWSSALANAVTTTFFTTNSSLNPNAKVFTPLNPNAKEFQPKAIPVAVPEKTISSPDVQLKKVAQRKCTPFISISPGDITSSQAKVDSATVETDDENDDSEDEEEDDDGGDDVDHSHLERKRLLSSCSLDDFIIFEDQEGPKINREKASPFLIAFINGTADESDDEDLGQENDDNWDNATIESNLDDIDLEQLGLAPRLDVSTLPGSADVTDSTNEYPGSDLDPEVIMKKVAEANEKWVRGLKEAEEEETSLIKKKKKDNITVYFSEPLVTQVQIEDPEMRDELRSARIPSSEILRGMRPDED